MKATFKSAIQGGHANAILYAGAIGLLASDLIPTPADAVYFYMQQKNKERLVKGEITPKQYWARDLVSYYGLNPIWWGLVLLGVVSVKGSPSKKAKVGLSIIAAGAVIGVIHKNIKKDEKIFQKPQNI